MSKTVLVTGISGFIGLYCVKELLNKGYKVKGTVRNSSKQNEVINTFKKNKINIKDLKFSLPLTTKPFSKVSEALDLMQPNNISILPVIDDSGLLIGSVKLSQCI